MSKTTAKKAIGVLWLQICQEDGAARAVTYASSIDLNEADKLALLTAFFRLRVMGYHPNVLSQLCPIALLKAETQDAIGALPEVTESEPEDDTFDPLEDLSEEQREDVLAFQEKQSRKADAIRLGLV